MVGSPLITPSSTPARRLGVERQVGHDVAAGPVGQPAGGAQGLVVEPVHRAHQSLGRLGEQLELGLGLEIFHAPILSRAVPAVSSGARSVRGVGAP